MCVSIQFDRVTVYSLDEQRQVKFVHSTSIQSTTLSKNEEVRNFAVSGELLKKLAVIYYSCRSGY
jgi:hypothetical protein